MKSKTSFFNGTIFKKNITHYWPIWVGYLVYLLIAAPLSIWLNANDQWYYEYYDETARMYEIIQNVASLLISPAVIFVFAVAMALAVFSYLYFPKNANMIHALPVNRLELFTTNYLSGLACLLVPQLVAFFASVLVCMGNEITCIQYLFFAVLCQIGLTFFAYSLAVFVAMFTGQILAMPIYFFILNYLYVGCLYILNVIIGLVCYGVTDRWNPGKSTILSPLYYLGNNLRVKAVYVQGINGAQDLELVGTYLVGIYAVAAIPLTIAAYRFYRRRQIETAGDWISVGFVKLIFRWGVALCGGIVLALGFMDIIRQYLVVDGYLCSVLCVIVTGFICFFGAEMLLCKNFKVFRKRRLLEWVGVTAVAVAFITLFKVDAFGIERHVPQADEIEVAFVYMDYPIQVEEEDMEALLDIHRDVIAHKKEYQKAEQQTSGYYYTTFRYYLKDGTTFERRYPIPITEEYLTDNTTPAAKILAWESEPDNLKKQILGKRDKENEYIRGSIDLYNDDFEYHDRVFDKDETIALAEAIEKDIEAGNYDAYYLSSIAGEGIDFYYNDIILEYYNDDGYYDNWDYYDNYRYFNGEAVQTAEMADNRISSNYITFGPECVNTVRALEELQIVDDTWRLWTTREREAFEMR